jgi:hypothetical protein
MAPRFDADAVRERDLSDYLRTKEAVKSALNVSAALRDARALWRLMVARCA